MKDLKELQYCRECIEHENDKGAEMWLSGFVNNYYGYGYLEIYGSEIDIESVWIDNVLDVYIHATCKEFEGDLKFISLSKENQLRVVDAIEKACKEGECS